MLRPVNRSPRRDRRSRIAFGVQGGRPRRDCQDNPYRENHREAKCELTWFHVCLLVGARCRAAGALDRGGEDICDRRHSLCE
jgi:hypothetical protein